MSCPIKMRNPLEDSFPDGWTDEIVTGSLKKNRDGSVTVEALINIYEPDGSTVYQKADLRVRLKRLRP